MTADTAGVSFVDALFLAAKGGGAADVEELLKKHKVDPNVTDNLGNTALHYAAAAGHLGVVRLLLQAPGVSLSPANHVRDTPLHKAAWRGHKEVVEALVQAGAGTTATNASGQQPLALAKDASIAALLQPVGPASEYPEVEDEDAEGGSDSD